MISPGLVKRKSLQQQLKVPVLVKRNCHCPSKVVEQVWDEKVAVILGVILVLYLAFSSLPCCSNMDSVLPRLEICIKKHPRNIDKINVACPSSKGKSYFSHSSDKGLSSWHEEGALVKGS